MFDNSAYSSTASHSEPALDTALQSGAAGLPFLAAAKHLWSLWRIRVAERRLAACMSERDLHDLALTRGDVFRAMSQPFWRRGD